MIIIDDNNDAIILEVLPQSSMLSTDLVSLVTMVLLMAIVLMMVMMI
jgi:hypothetical protein